MTAPALPDDPTAAGPAVPVLEVDRLSVVLRARGREETLILGSDTLRRAVYRIGARAFGDRVRLAWASADRTASTAQWRGLVALGEGWSPPAFPISGEDVMKAGVPKGPMVGEVLREVEEWWVDHDFIDDKFSAIEKLKAVAQGMAY